MESVKKQVTDFLARCEDVRNCKFIMATTKIKDLLKSIANSAELYEVFDTVASRFDYIAAKQRCFVDADAAYGRSRIILPDTRGDRLAFIFCLLVEIDRGDIQINYFLQKYYPKDGSYYASYHAFCDEIIGNLEGIIAEIFAQELSAEEQIEERQPAAAIPAPDSAAVRVNSVCLLIAQELDFVSACALSEEDKEAAASILTRLSRAVKVGDKEDVNALTCGYNYFVMFTKQLSPTANTLFEELGALVGGV